MFDEQRAARHLDPILGEFFGGTVNLKQSQIDFLVKRHNVPAAALGRDADGGGMVIGAGDVEFESNLFDWSEVDGAETPPTKRTMSALVFVARDRAGDPLDLVAWSPRTDQVATRFGRAAVLGEHSLHGLRIGEPPRVHRDVMAWLRARRDGIVIIDSKRAGRVLIDAPDRLVAEDEAHAQQVAIVMSGCLDLQRIVIPIRKAA